MGGPPIPAALLVVPEKTPIENEKKEAPVSFMSPTT